MNNSIVIKKSLLASSVAAVISVNLAQPVMADIYYFTVDNGGCFVNGTAVTCTGPGDGTFTMLTSAGAPLQNTSYPYYGDTSWAFGLRTQIGGSVTIDTANGTGVASINPFDFYDGGSAVASGITMAEIDGDPNSNGTMWLGNMLFDWNGNNGIPVSIVWDMQGLVSSLSGLDLVNLGDVITNVGATPASNDIKKGSVPIGAAPIATTTYNTSTVSGAGMGTNPSGETPLVVDGVNVGGSPMIAGPFVGFNANFDFKTLTFAGYNDTTAPVLTLGATTLNLTQGDSFDPNAPGVSVTCLDNADGSDNLTAAVGANPNISFTVDNGNGGPAVDTSTPGTYEVLYTCSDNAGARSAIAEDPNNLGSPTVPADNTSASTTILTVNVVGAGIPAITITNGTPTSLQACTTYTDAGATALDAEDGDLTSSIAVTDVNSIIGTSPNEGSYTIQYNVTDSDMNAAATQTRTVNVVDTLPPVLTVTGGSSISIESTACPSYVKPTATAVDANGDCNQPSPNIVSTSSTINCVVPSGQDSIQSSLLYSAADTANTPNTGSTSATVTVYRSEPVITLLGNASMVLAVGDTYTEPGMDVHDVQDGDLTAVTTTGVTQGVGAGAGNLSHTITSNVNTAVAGTYTVTYDVTDSDTNTATQVTRTVQVGAFAQGSNFTMLTPTGSTFGGTNDVVMVWDQSLNTNVASTNFNMQIYSALPEKFFSYVWTAHHVRVFGPGTYTFDTTCTTAQLEAGTSACNNLPLVSPQTQQFLTMTVATGQIGVHMLFDWNGNYNIDVVNVWDQNAVWNDPDGPSVVKNNLYSGSAGLAPDPATTWDLVSTDLDGDGINGAPMVDGPFIGYNATFNANPGATGAVPVIQVTAPSTKLGSGSLNIGMLLVSLLSLIGFGVHRKIKK